MRAAFHAFRRCRSRPAEDLLPCFENMHLPAIMPHRRRMASISPARRQSLERYQHAIAAHAPSVTTLSAALSVGLPGVPSAPRPMTTYSHNWRPGPPVIPQSPWPHQLRHSRPLRGRASVFACLAGSTGDRTGRAGGLA